MRTVNISLPENLAERIEILLAQKEFVSRSEVVRTALRVFFTLEQKIAPVELVSFTKRPLADIKSELKGAGHDSAFVNSVIKGLKDSSMYKK